MNNEMSKELNLQLQHAMNSFHSFSHGGTSDIRVFFAPGRVNLIGEHTDYNGGHVLPAALEIGTWAFVRPRQDDLFRFASTSFSQVVETRADDVVYRDEDDYANYPKGVIREFQKLGIKLTGCDFLFFGNLPNGAGLSSSASIEVVTAAALNALNDAGLSPERFALLSQAAENQFVGVNCGIMDQFSIAMGKKNHALALDCRTLEYQLVGLEMQDCQLVISNTNYRRGLADSKYNERRAQCEEVVSILQSVRPGLKDLCELSTAEWTDLESHVTDTVLRKRASHVISENERVALAVQAMQSGDTEAFGRLMNASHVSLRDDYEVTGSALDTLVEAAWKVEGCIGSRMTGAGFGGCTVSLVKKDAVDAFMRAVTDEYFERTGLQASFYATQIGDGVKEVTVEVKSVCQF